ncbi:MAG: prolipoprotein diacylglyceryl transferase [Lachnospiraceae bacterium]|nr:prolipoprotein diacylglyceryl transferase [Lachnospiraceae bacterium]
MFAYFQSPFGMQDSYILALNAGLVAGLIFQVILLLRLKKKPAFLCYLAAYYAVMMIGRSVAAVWRGLSVGGIDSFQDVVYAAKYITGSHFSGHLFCFMILYIPFLWLIREFAGEIFGLDLGDTASMLNLGELIIATLPVQHFFNRLGCLLRGCCYGVEYDGPLSLSLPYNTSLDHCVFPCQILEMAGMIVLTVVVIFCIVKRRHFAAAILIGFGVVFFVAEFVTDNTDAVKVFGLTLIQLLSVFFVIAGLVTARLQKKLKAEW